ncbi:MAG: DUF3419 family protein [Mesorhizobium sp.]
MTDISADLGTRKRVARAIYQHRALSRAGLSERLFALAFSGLVYPQIWEDPEVDIEAMQLGEGHRVVTIASGGCNILAYLSVSPASIDAVDLNAAHIALNRLKLTAMTRLPAYEDVLRFFGTANVPHNSQAYDRFIAPHLDATSRAHWEKRDILGRRRITVFDRDFYRTGLLGLFIGAGHRISKLFGVDPADIIKAQNIGEQRRFFHEKLAPIFDRPLLKAITRSKASLFGLGIPPAQYDALAQGRPMVEVLRQRLEKLACHYPLKDNYFARQAFGRSYAAPGEAALPRYLDKRHFPAIRDNAGRVRVHHTDFGSLLAQKPAASVDRYILLDAQDWMTDDQLNALWSEITRTAAQGARVIFRTAGLETILPGRVSASLLDQWDYRGEESRDFTAQDRSAIYGGFHLYVRR